MDAPDHIRLEVTGVQTQGFNNRPYVTGTGIVPREADKVVDDRAKFTGWRYGRERGCTGTQQLLGKEQAHARVEHEQAFFGSRRILFEQQTFWRSMDFPVRLGIVMSHSFHGPERLKWRK